MHKTKQGRALFYTRDSGGKAENTPGQYVVWAQKEAKDRGLTFDGTPERIEAMIRDGRAVDSDLYLDYNVKGNLLSRRGWDALVKEALADSSVTHILIPRRDRLARPDDALDGINLEKGLRQAGKTLVFIDQTLPPIQKGKRQDIAELIRGVVDYNRSGEDRRDLAQKILFAQIRLAKAGYSTGGRAPYGFERYLCKEDGTLVRKLENGERVRKPGHHVVWYPDDPHKIDVIKRILNMLKTQPASRVAAQLTAEGIPSPDAGRQRKDNGQLHLVSGVWHQTTITSIARNPILAAMCSYGARSMGDKMRFTPNGPRDLEDSDYRPDEKPKIIRNPESQVISTRANFEPVITPEEQQEVIAILNQRGGTQRGKPRSRNNDNNPLGGRIYDMNCSWPMYREPYGGSFRYKCGLYQQSHGEECDHNHINGPVAANFMLTCIRQLLLSPTRRQMVEERLRCLANEESEDRSRNNDLNDKIFKLEKLAKEIELISNNMALAETPEERKATAVVFNKKLEQKKVLEAEIARAETERPNQVNIQTLMESTINSLDQLDQLMGDSNNLGTVTKLFQKANAKLFLDFHPVQEKNRVLNKMCSGVVTFGSAAAPIEPYQGPTAKKTIKCAKAMLTSAQGAEICVSAPTNEEEKSLGNISRGDWI